MLSDRDQITHLLNRYCELYDAGDLTGYAALFAHGRTVGPDGVREGADAVRRHHEETTIFYDGVPRTSHVTSNVSIDIADGARTATARCYVTVFQALPDFPLQVIFAGQYFDTFEKHEGTWRWVERRAEPRLLGDLSRHSPGYTAAGGRT